MTRFFSAARSPWDWDEAQFALALREYDVALHQPHPPGFPLFAAAARLVHVVVPSEFRALQVVVVVSACLLFPLAFLLAREAGFRFRTAYHGALLFVFLPTVWFYGGTGFSDVPGVAAILAACWLLLRARQEQPERSSATSFYLGAFVLALAAGVRPQALLFGCVPALLATFAQWKISRTRVFLGIALGAVTMALLYLGAALASHSFEGYLVQLEHVREWVRTMDAYTSPHRPPVRELLTEFVLLPMRGGRLGFVVAALAGLAILFSFLRRERAIWILLGIFLPFIAFALFMLDINSYGRYGVGYVALHALLAARGAEVVTAPLRRLRVAAPAQALLMLAIVLRYAWWTFPTIQDVRSTLSPTAAVVTWAEKLPPHATLWVNGGLSRMITASNVRARVQVINEFTEIPDNATVANAWYLSEGVTPVRGALAFRRPHNRTWEIARQRYFETYAVPLSALWRFGEGWYGEEASGEGVMRWMRRQSRTLVPASAGMARLTLTVLSPHEVQPRQVVAVRWNGREVGQFVSTGEPTTWRAVVEAREGSNVLELAASGSVKGGPADPRDFAVLLLEYGLQELPGRPSAQ